VTIKKISTAELSREEWVKLRADTFGGSDAASILGLNPYKSRYALYLEKTGQLEPEDISGREAVRLGTDLEEYVAKRFTEATGKKVRRENYTVFREDMPWAHANYDRLVIGEKAGLECKTTNALQMSKFKNGEFPANYYCQCMHYMMVSGLERWYLAVLVLGIDFKVFCIERDEEEIKALVAAERDFWERVQNRIPPDVDGTASSLEALAAQYPASEDGTAIDLTANATDLMILDACNSQIKELEEKKAAAQARIMQALGNCEKGSYGVYQVSWKSQQRSTFDKKKFEAERGKIPEGYFKTTENRTFRFRKGD
jgi:putative phage-type endonuclease